MEDEEAAGEVKSEVKPLALRFALITYRLDFETAKKFKMNRTHLSLSAEHQIQHGHHIRPKGAAIHL